jgi:hypothetical protein
MTKWWGTSCVFGEWQVQVSIVVDFIRVHSRKVCLIDKLDTTMNGDGYPISSL